MKKLFWMAALCIGLVLPTASPVWADVSPEAVLQATSEKLIAALNENQDRIATDRGVLYHIVNDIVLPGFDFEAMSQLAMGLSWRSATQAQRDEFVAQFRDLLVNTYAIALTHYSNQRVKIFPIQMAPGARIVTAKTEISRPDAPAVPILYKLLNKNGDWKVFDVIVDGVSLVTQYRSEFTQQMRNGGVEAVINYLKERNAKFTALDQPTAESGASAQATATPAGAQ